MGGHLSVPGVRAPERGGDLGIALKGTDWKDIWEVDLEGLGHQEMSVGDRCPAAERAHCMKEMIRLVTRGEAKSSLEAPGHCSHWECWPCCPFSSAGS